MEKDKKAAQANVAECKYYLRLVELDWLKSLFQASGVEAQLEQQHSACQRTAEPRIYVYFRMITTSLAPNQTARTNNSEFTEITTTKTTKIRAIAIHIKKMDKIEH